MIRLGLMLEQSRLHDHGVHPADLSIPEVEAILTARRVRFHPDLQEYGYSVWYTGEPFIARRAA